MVSGRRKTTLSQWTVGRSISDFNLDADRRLVGDLPKILQQPQQNLALRFGLVVLGVSDSRTRVALLPGPAGKREGNRRSQIPDGPVIDDSDLLFHLSFFRASHVDRQASERSSLSSMARQTQYLASTVERGITYLS